MNSDGFTVDPDALRGARDRIGRLAAELTGPPRDVPSAEDFGHDRLALAVNAFAASEKRGLSLLAKEAETIRHGLSETIETYQRTDEDGAGWFRGI